MQKSMTISLTELAQVLCKADGKDPTNYWREFDRNAAASMYKEYEGWEDDVFPMRYAWEDYLHLANAVMDYLESKK